MNTRTPEQQSSACELSSKMSLSEATSMVSTVSLETTTQISTPKVRNYYPSSDIVLTRYTCEELMITGKPNQRTNAEKNAKNYFNKTIRKAVFEYDLQNIKDKRTYKTVEQVILSYNPSLCEKENNTKELKMIRKVVCSRLRYNRYISRKHNGLLGENKKDTEE